MLYINNTGERPGVPVGLVIFLKNRQQSSSFPNGQAAGLYCFTLARTDSKGLSFSFLGFLSNGGKVNS